MIAWVGDRGDLSLKGSCSVNAGEGDQGDRDLDWFRAVVLAALSASIVITWPLWNARHVPPLLPAMPLPQMSIGAAILGACAATLFVPRAGAIAVTLLIAYGMMSDQTRMQPEFFSLPILLWGSFPSRGIRFIARVHLISLWFYAGLHKVLNPGFLTELGPKLIRSFPFPLPERLASLLVLFVVSLEIGSAVLAVVPGTRQIAAWSALFLHLSILIALFPFGDSRNPAVWSWNVALACSGFALIAPWKSSLLLSFRSNGLLSRAIGVALAIMPLGFYAGLVDADPAHQLYSSSIASASVYCPSGCRPEQDVNATWFTLNVPLPPQPQLFAASFLATCAGGDVLRIVEPHRPPWSNPGEPQIVHCQKESLPAAHP